MPKISSFRTTKKKIRRTIYMKPEHNAVADTMSSFSSFIEQLLDETPEFIAEVRKQKLLVATKESGKKADKPERVIVKKSK